MSVARKGNDAQRGSGRVASDLSPSTRRVNGAECGNRGRGAAVRLRAPPRSAAGSGAPRRPARTPSARSGNSRSTSSCADCGMPRNPSGPGRKLSAHRPSARTSRAWREDVVIGDRRAGGVDGDAGLIDQMAGGAQHLVLAEEHFQPWPRQQDPVLRRQAQIAARPVRTERTAADAQRPEIGLAARRAASSVTAPTQQSGCGRGRG